MEEGLARRILPRYSLSPRFHPRAPPIRHADTSARGRRGEGVTNQASRRAGLERPLPFQGRGWAGGIDGSFLGSRPGLLYCFANKNPGS